MKKTKTKTTADYQVAPIPGHPHEYEVTRRAGGTLHHVSLNDFGGRGSCACEDFKFRIGKNRRLGLKPDSCIHIEAACEFDKTLPMF